MCGNPYSHKSRLRAHIHEHANGRKYPCTYCGKACGRADACRRHEVSIPSEHTFFTSTTSPLTGLKDNIGLGIKLACPGCSKTFRKDYLAVHLGRISKCQLASRLPTTELGDQPKELRVNDNGDGMQPNDALTGITAHFDHSAGPEISLKTSVPTTSPGARTVNIKSREACDICGIDLSVDEDETLGHIERHRTELFRRPYECRECMITFAFIGDCTRHSQAADGGLCGFNFKHVRRNFLSEVKVKCGGHHKREDGLHELSHQCLAEWELSQIRTYRATIVRLLAERLDHTRPSHMSLSESRCPTLDVTFRCSQSSMRSLLSIPACLRFEDNMEYIDELSSELERLMPATSVNNTSQPRPLYPVKVRPESIIGPYALERTLEGRPRASLALPVVRMQSNSVQRIQALRKPPSSNPQLPITRRRLVQAAARYILPARNRRA